MFASLRTSRIGATTSLACLRLAAVSTGRTPIVFTARMAYSTGGSYEHIVVSKPATGVRLVTLNRPKALNALFSPLIAELNHALFDADKDPEIGAIVITGSEKAFAAGADIKEMKDKTVAEVYGKDFIENWNDQTRVKKPIIAAVNGYALGGGCELALMADIIYAGEKAVFGQPEIKLGVIPGAGGTQRLARYIGKARASELILTGRNFSAQEALEWGMVAKVFKPEELVDQAVKTAAEIAQFSPLAVKAAKEAINEGYNLSLEQGLKYERRVFHTLFGTEDQKEGMAAFAEKRKASFTGK
ncbi:Ehd3p [Sugiyamaella lignohabitans]|uniref:Probable enoyl-CoA hydratase, mitochondrial n=1 Tax=Sugiyamaella lignohabitans TaxID=796027 RepID=A0A167DDA2_9ASCO|nr:Ehd3p [Sugiyamaella lignohabitans]ANB12784.1 Ehd3p [Sugiyamaella lignohabitans]